MSISKWCIYSCKLRQKKYKPRKYTLKYMVCPIYRMSSRNWIPLIWKHVESCKKDFEYRDYTYEYAL